jgi:hypothetical protein
LFPFGGFVGLRRVFVKPYEALDGFLEAGLVRSRKGAIKPQIGIPVVRMVHRPARVCIGVVLGQSDGARI